MGNADIMDITDDKSSELLSRLAIYVALLGWVILGLYWLFTSMEYMDFSNLMKDMFSSSYVGIKVRSLVLIAPLMSMVLGYLVNERSKYYSKLARAERRLERSYKELTSLHEGLIFAFAKALDAKSPWTKGHSERVTEYSLIIAREMGLEDVQMETLKIAALLHDIGKIAIPDGVLNNSGKLTAEDFMHIRMHPAKGDEILRSISHFDSVRAVIRHHHEHVNGAGYPDRITGDKIPLLSRIICVADAFDAMTADRPYRYAPGREYAVKELQNCSGLQFDREVVKAFLSTREMDMVVRETQAGVSGSAPSPSYTPL